MREGQCMEKRNEREETKQSRVEGKGRMNMIEGQAILSRCMKRKNRGEKSRVLKRNRLCVRKSVSVCV